MNKLHKSTSIVLIVIMLTQVACLCGGTTTISERPVSRTQPTSTPASSGPIPNPTLTPPVLVEPTLKPLTEEDRIEEVASRELTPKETGEFWNGVSENQAAVDLLQWGMDAGHLFGDDKTGVASEVTLNTGAKVTYAAIGTNGFMLTEFDKGQSITYILTQVTEDSVRMLNQDGSITFTDETVVVDDQGQQFEFSGSVKPLARTVNNQGECTMTGLGEFRACLDRYMYSEIAVYSACGVFVSIAAKTCWAVGTGVGTVACASAVAGAIFSCGIPVGVCWYEASSDDPPEIHIGARHATGNIYPFCEPGEEDKIYFAEEYQVFYTVTDDRDPLLSPPSGSVLLVRGLWDRQGVSAKDCAHQVTDKIIEHPKTEVPAPEMCPPGQTCTGGFGHAKCTGATPSMPAPQPTSVGEEPLPTSTLASEPDSVVGTWSVYLDWDCDGGESDGHIGLVLYENHSFSMNALLQEGAWTLSGSQLTVAWDNGLEWTGQVSGDTVTGTTVSTEGKTGCWSATRTSR